MMIHDEFCVSFFRRWQRWWCFFSIIFRCPTLGSLLQFWFWGLVVVPTMWLQHGSTQDCGPQKCWPWQRQISSANVGKAIPKFTIKWAVYSIHGIHDKPSIDMGGLSLLCQHRNYFIWWAMGRSYLGIEHKLPNITVRNMPDHSHMEVSTHGGTPK